MTQPAPPFAVQRLIFLAMVMGVTMYAVVIGIVLQGNDGKGLAEGLPEQLPWAPVVVGALATLGAFVLRTVMSRGIESHPPAVAAHRRFMARFVPIVALEGGALFALTIWMLTGETVPPLATAMVLLALAIAIVPLKDVEAGA